MGASYTYIWKCGYLNSVIGGWFSKKLVQDLPLGDVIPSKHTSYLSSTITVRWLCNFVRAKCKIFQLDWEPLFVPIEQLNIDNAKQKVSFAPWWQEQLLVWVPEIWICPKKSHFGKHVNKFSLPASQSYYLKIEHQVRYFIVSYFLNFKDISSGKYKSRCWWVGEGKYRRDIIEKLLT